MPEDSIGAWLLTAYDAYRYSCLWRWDIVNDRDPDEMERKLIDAAIAV